MQHTFSVPSFCVLCVLVLIDSPFLTLWFSWSASYIVLFVLMNVNNFYPHLFSSARREWCSVYSMFTYYSHIVHQTKATVLQQLLRPPLRISCSCTCERRGRYPPFSFTDHVHKSFLSATTAFCIGTSTTSPTISTSTTTSPLLLSLSVHYELQALRYGCRSQGCRFVLSTNVV